MSRRRPFIALRAGLCLALATACAGAGAGHGVPDAGGETFGRLAVTLTVAQGGGMSVASTGRLVRYRNLDAESAQVLAGVPAEVPALGRCVLADAESNLEDTLATAPPDAVVQMLDAGEILVRLAGQSVKLSPRYLPDVLPFVSGVAYDSDMPSVAPLEPAAREEALITAFGGEEVGPFSTSVEVPAVPHILALVRGDNGLSVTWTQEGEDHVTVVLSRDTGPSLRCSVADSGQLLVPAADLGRFLDGGHGDATVAVERARHGRFAAKGLASGELVVTMREIAALP